MGLPLSGGQPLKYCLPVVLLLSLSVFIASKIGIVSTLTRVTRMRRSIIFFLIVREAIECLNFSRTVGPSASLPYAGRGIHSRARAVAEFKGHAGVVSGHWVPVEAGYCHSLIGMSTTLGVSPADT